ncbi:MrcB family domain-containing protein [Roseivirga pacifica]
MKNIFKEPLETYLSHKKEPFRNNPLANRFRKDFPKLIESVINNNNGRYKVDGSSGQGNWAECPWIAIFDILVTQSAQSGYYPVYIFRSDMSGLFLSLNQGVTQVREDYKSETRKTLKNRALDFRGKINFDENDFLTEIDLKAKSSTSRLYEAGNIIAKYYPAESLPNDDTLLKDLKEFLGFYELITYNDSSSTDNLSHIGFERKKVRQHLRIERNSSLSKKVKRLKGYQCEACDLNFTQKYGFLGNEFIEAHHLTPISEIKEGDLSLDLIEDFAVLCSNCHSMIHRMNNPSDIDGLRRLIKENANH